MLTFIFLKHLWWKWEKINVAENRMARLKEDGAWIFSCGVPATVAKLIHTRKNL